MNWLIKKLVDSGWVRLGLAFRWIFGTKELFTGLVNESDLNIIESRYKLIEQAGFFSGVDGATNQQAFIQALFAYNLNESDLNIIESRYKLIEQAGFFAGEVGATNQQAFIQALFASKALNFFSLSGDIVKPLENFLSFIQRVFFQGPSAKDNKQTFIDAVLTQNNGESNALSRAALKPAPNSESSPLKIVLNSLTEVDCFIDDDKKQKVIHGICALNKVGQNALYNALRSRGGSKPKNEDSCPNIKVLLDALYKADCFNGPSSEANKKTLIQAVLAVGESGGVLSEAMWNTNALQQILAVLTEAGCFTSENGIQAFVDALIKPDGQGINALSDAAYAPDSLKLIYTQLEKNGCFTSVNNKQKIINAIFSQDRTGDSALLRACEGEKSFTLILDILTKAGCFDDPIGSANRQAFVSAAFAANKNGFNCLYYHTNNEQILNQLMDLKYFEGPFAEQNKQAFITAVLAPAKIGETPWGSVLGSDCSMPSFFPLLLEQLTLAGCFSGDSLNSNKKAFINAVFEKDNRGEYMCYDSISQLLKKLEEAGCFNNAECKKQFCQAVRANGNKILFCAIEKGLQGYSALHENLLLAGFSAQDIKALLNESTKQKYDSWAEATPLMMALRNKNDLLAERLIADGAEELTEQQKQQVESYIKKQQENEDKVVQSNIEAIDKKLTQPEKPVLSEEPKLERSGSLSALSLFAEKQATPGSDCSEHEVDDDLALGNQSY